jgi:hypothetical protein
MVEVERGCNGNLRSLLAMPIRNRHAEIIGNKQRLRNFLRTQTESYVVHTYICMYVHMYVHIPYSREKAPDTKTNISISL